MNATTTKSTKSAKETPAKEAVNTYLDTLTEGHQKMTEALKEARTRGLRVSEELVDSILAGQRDILELSKRLALNPTDIAGNMKAVLEAATTAQERALAFAKLMYREQSDVSGELRKMFQSVFDNSTNVGQTARKLASFWIKPN